MALNQLIIPALIQLATKSGQSSNDEWAKSIKEDAISEFRKEIYTFSLRALLALSAFGLLLYSLIVLAELGRTQLEAQPSGLMLSGIAYGTLALLCAVASYLLLGRNKSPKKARAETPPEERRSSEMPDTMRIVSAFSEGFMTGLSEHKKRATEQMLRGPASQEISLPS